MDYLFKIFSKRNLRWVCQSKADNVGEMILYCYVENHGFWSPKHIHKTSCVMDWKKNPTRSDLCVFKRRFYRPIDLNVFFQHVHFLYIFVLVILQAVRLLWFIWLHCNLFARSQRREGRKILKRFLLLFFWFFSNLAIGWMWLMFSRFFPISHRSRKLPAVRFVLGRF